MERFSYSVDYGSRIGIRKMRRTLEFLTSEFGFPIRFILLDNLVRRFGKFKKSLIPLLTLPKADYKGFQDRFNSELQPIQKVGRISYI